MTSIESSLPAATPASAATAAQRSADGFVQPFGNSELQYRVAAFDNIQDREIVFQLRRFAGWSWDEIDQWFNEVKNNLRRLYIFYVPRRGNEDIASAVLALPEPSKTHMHDSLNAEERTAVYSVGEGASTDKVTFNHYPGVYRKGSSLRVGQNSWASCFVSDTHIVVGMFGLSFKYFNLDDGEVMSEIADVNGPLRTAGVISGVNLPSFRGKGFGKIMVLAIEDDVRKNDLADTLSMFYASRNKFTPHLAKSLGYTFYSTTYMRWFQPDDRIIVTQKRLKQSSKL
ncbi:hypothetical protein GQ42DRAFT_164207 [Ramicandelaber brevisporus]|nr:hypothetical protein GQ42DRAFT_164207 [Ramicandelaber brevisporus]